MVMVEETARLTERVDEPGTGDGPGAWALRRRPRRLRASASIRSLVRETELRPSDMVYPMFVMGGQGLREPVPSLPGVERLSVDLAVEEAQRAWADGIQGIMLFGIPDRKDDIGSAAWDDEGPVQQAVRAIKKALPHMWVATDVCLCQYTTHGHCGHVRGETIDNDATLPRLVEVALSHARAGADMVAPSDMMDGRVGAMRDGLDAAGFCDTGIMAYSAKYASAFYGPFREASGSAPRFGDRRTYQMDPGNRREAVLEAELDVAEGADIVMVKPALAYLDVVAEVRRRVNVPVAAYNVSGEYAMVKAAAQAGWVDEQAVVQEMLLSMKRAGADVIITYFARDAAKALRS